MTRPLRVVPAPPEDEVENERLYADLVDPHGADDDSEESSGIDPGEEPQTVSAPQMVDAVAYAVDPPAGRLSMKDLTGLDFAGRQAVLPKWMKGRAEAKFVARFVALWALHQVTFHLTRSPKYAGRLVARTAVGAWRAWFGYLSWLLDRDSAPLRAEARRRNDSAEYRNLAKDRDRHVHTRLLITAAYLGMAGVVLLTWWLCEWLLPWFDVPGLVWVGLATAVVVALVRNGAPADRPLFDVAVVATGKPIRLTSRMVNDALGSLGIKGINDALKTGRMSVEFTAPILRDGPGWRADIQLPRGVTVADVMERREALASGLRRPLGCVWPEPVGEDNPGRLCLWVGDADLSKTPQPPWPLLKSGVVDLFQDIPFGTDQRGRKIGMCLMFASMLIGAMPRFGKALALDTPVPIPDGWTTMGDLRDGDAVFDENGAICTVVTAHDVRYDRPCYEVEFSDGSVVVADAEHLWQVETRSARSNGTAEKVLTTEEMLGSVRVARDGRCNYSVRTTETLALPDADLPVGAYTFGAWLGDGTSSTGSVTNIDDEVIDEIRSEGYDVRLIPSSTEGGRASTYRVAGLTSRLRSLAVLGDKHIPTAYLRASEGQRRALLAGLMDTDGWVQRARVGDVTSSTVMVAFKSRRLAEDVRRLVASLGYVSTLHSREVACDGVPAGVSWQITFCPDQAPFRLPRKVAAHHPATKASNFRRFITDIRPVESVPVRCITVDSPSSLYLVGDQCIPTHNTFALRLVLLAVALDARAELRIWELKGTGDLGPLEPVSHRYGSGADEETLDAAMADMRDIYKELDRRAKRIKTLPRELVPENKVTPEVAGRRTLGLHPMVMAIDECQELFSHPDYKDEAARLGEAILKRGPAMGVIAIFATQRPDAKSVPTGISSNALLRFCLKVMGQVENDMVLGTSKYKAGIRATMFSKRDKGIGWLDGHAEDPQITRTYYVDGPTAEKIVARARAARLAAGTITGHAAGEASDKAEDYSLLDDVVVVFATAERMHSETVIEGLIALRPSAYEGWSPTVLANNLKATCGLKTKQMEIDGRNKYGIRRDELEQALAARAEARQLPAGAPSERDPVPIL